MSVKISLRGLTFGLSGPAGKAVTVHFSIQSDFGELKLECPERYNDGESLNTVVERSRQRIVQFAAELRQAASDPMLSHPGV